MKNILNNFISFNVLVAKVDGKGVQGELLAVDGFGITVLAEIDSDHEVKEKVVVYIPHKNIDTVSAREDVNSRLDLLIGGML